MKKLFYIGLGVLAFAGVTQIPRSWGILTYYPWGLLFVLLVIDIAKKKLLRAPLYFLGLVLTYCAMLSYILIIAPSFQNYSERVSFDSTTWKRGENLKNPVRIHMIDDLLRSRALVGLNKTQINNLLGTPSVTSYFKEYDYVYWLGPERGPFSIDSEWLGIKFKDGVVSEATILID